MKGLLESSGGLGGSPGNLRDYSEGLGKPKGRGRRTLGNLRAGPSITLGNFRNGSRKL